MAYDTYQILDVLDVPPALSYSNTPPAAVPAPMRFRILDICAMGNSSWDFRRSTPRSVVVRGCDSLRSSVGKESLSAERPLRSTAEVKVS